MKIKNPLVVVFSLAALGFVALTFIISPYFVIGAIILMLINQRLLMKKKK
jgi:predicted branched-subunit amino acid permease